MLKSKKYKFLFLLFSFYLNANNKSWTFLTYIAGDNDLNKFINANIEQMKLGANDNVNVLAFVNTKNNNKKIARKLLITKDNIIPQGPDLYNLDSGKKEAVIKAIDWALENYKSDRFILVLWDHGSGPLNKILQSYDYLQDDNIEFSIQEEKGICYDYTTGSYLTDHDLMEICQYTKNKSGKKLDILACDACLMANIEIAYAIKDSVNYLVSSQEVVAGFGYNYNLILQNLKDQDLNAQEFAKKIVLAYKEAYKNLNNYYTLSAINLENIDKLIENLDNLSKTLIYYLENKKNYKIDKVITFAGFTNKNIRFDEPDYIDLYNFYFNLDHYINISNLEISDVKKIRKLTQEGMALIKDAVVENVSGSKYNLVQGISIYLSDKIHHSYNKLYWTEKTLWTSFLNSYIKAKNKTLYN